MKALKQLFKNNHQKKKWQQQLNLIRSSDYFNASYYLEQNPDVAAARLDPAEHFLKFGGFEGRKPSERFDPEFYLAENTDVAESGINPLLHFLQYGLAEQREPLPAAAQLQQEEEQVSIDSGVQLLQLLLLQGQYQVFEHLITQLQQQQLSNIPMRQQWLELLQCERWLAEGRTDDCKAWLKAHRSHDYYWYYQARMQLLQGKATEAFNAAQSFLYQQPKSAEGVYLLAEAAQAQAVPDKAWTALSQFAVKSRRARNWPQLAMLVQNNSELERYLSLLRQWCLEKPNARFNPDVSLASAEACQRGDNLALAKQVLHDCIAFHQSRKNGFKLLQQTEIRFSQQPNLPLWPMPFQALPTAQALDCRQRMLDALQSLYATLAPLSIQPFLLLNTLKEAVQGDGDFDAGRPLLLGLTPEVALPELAEVLTESPFFYPPQQQGNGLNITHSNGIQLKLLGHRQHGDAWCFELHGTCFTTAVVKPEPFTLAGTELQVPSATGAYLQSFSDNWQQAGFDFVLHSQNRDIIQQDHHSLYCYQRLLTALIAEDTITEVQMLRELSKFESTASYQQLVASNYSIPTLEEIQKDGIKVVLFVSGIESVGYQANMWIPVLERLSVPCAIVIREKRTASELLPTTLPVYFLNSMNDLEVLEEAGVRTVLYPGNSQKATQMLRFHRLNHFFINHGESDKVVNQSKFLMAYDKLLVAGPLAEQRIRDAGLPVRDNQIVHVGRPQVEMKLQQAASPSTSVTTILYAPTWEGFNAEANYCSINSDGLNLLQALADSKRFKILFKPHPYTGYDQTGDAKQFLDKMCSYAKASSDVELFGMETDIHELMNRSDLLITDISSVLNDYLYTLKPIVLTNSRQFSEEKLHAEFPSTVSAYVINKSSEIVYLIDSILTDDVKFESRNTLKNHSLGSYPNGALEAFNQVVTSSAS